MRSLEHQMGMASDGAASCLVSILIRSRNDAPFLSRLLDAITVQECPLPHEILVCDDGSTDGTVELLRGRQDVRLVERLPGAYRPGRTLNALVRAAAGDIVVFNNSDAIPLDGHWLANLVAPIADGAADATFANQLPRPDATPLVRRDSERAFGDGSVSSHWAHFFSLVSSAAMRGDLLANPFDEDIQYSEDVEWAYRRDGFRIRYVPDARVEHSHNYTLRQLARRFYGEGYAENQIFGTRPPSMLRVLAGICADIVRDALSVVRNPAHLPAMIVESLLRRSVQRGAVWLGVREAARGRKPRIRSTDVRDGMDKPPHVESAAHPRKILFAGVDSSINGGLERFAVRAAAKLREAGCDVDVVDGIPQGLGYYDRVIMHKIPRSIADLRRLKLRYGDRLRFYAHDHELYCLRRHYYDPLRRPCSRMYSAYPCRLCALATRPQGIMRAVTRDMVGFLREMRTVRTFVQSGYMRNNLLRCGYAPEMITDVAPFWTDEVRMRFWHDFMPISADGVRPLRILYVGQLIAGKGVRVLMEAVKRLDIPFTLTFVGSGRDDALLHRMALGLADGAVRFAGWQADVASFLLSADVAVVPSLWNEPFGMVGPEALAAGVPVVAFDRGGIGDWLKPGETGLFAEANPDSLSAALTDMASADRLAAFSRAGAELVRMKYSSVRFMEGILS